MKRLLSALMLVLAASVHAGTSPVPIQSAVIQPRGPVVAWQLVAATDYYYVPPSTIGYYADLPTCERVRGAVIGKFSGRYITMICVEVKLP